MIGTTGARAGIGRLCNAQAPSVSICVLAGNEVLVELTPHDLTKGRITYRFMPGHGGPGGT